jgi:hypothetical protein
MKRSGKQGNSVREIFVWPLAVALLSTLGLITALTGDGWRDALSWVGRARPRRHLGDESPQNLTF